MLVTTYSLSKGKVKEEEQMDREKGKEGCGIPYSFFTFSFPAFEEKIKEKGQPVDLKSPVFLVLLLLQNRYLNHVSN